MDGATPPVVEKEVLSSQEAIRRKYLKHEASIKTIGAWYYLGATIGTVKGVSIMMLSGTGASGFPKEWRVLIGLMIIAICIFQFSVARGLWILNKKARLPAIVLSLIGVFVFFPVVLSPIGCFAFVLNLLIQAYIIYILVCSQSETVLSDDYKGVISDTPGIRYTIPMIGWIFITILSLSGLLALLLNH